MRKSDGTYEELVRDMESHINSGFEAGGPPGPELSLEVDLELIRRLDRNGPRYTSYPTADRFMEAYGPDTYAGWVKRRNIGGVERGLSLYMHLPFCRTICFYCACNKIPTRNDGMAERYLGYLQREVEMQAALFEGDHHVDQMHWGGGTPTFYGNETLGRLFDTVTRHFSLSPTGEYSVEIDPRTVTPESVRGLRTMGFNRMSLGVQDFDSEVQQAVNRIQGEAETLAVMDAARDAGFESLNVDLIYGLPRQNLISFNRTLAKIISARPDRIAVYSYAHLPTRFKPQRRISQAELPEPEVKLKLLALAIERLTDAGYVYIGMDHFARPDDALARAQREGRLHRNFQGYSTHANCDLIGMGVSAIGAMGPTYCQNHREIGDYMDSIDRGVIPVIRGIELSADDLVRRAVIQSLMCHFGLLKDSIEIGYLIDFDRYFDAEINDLRELEQLGLVSMEDRWIRVTPRGRLLIRNVCMVFDRYLRHQREIQSYSRVI